MKDNRRYFHLPQIILHLPHSSTYIPQEYRGLFYLDEEQLQEEILRMTDSHTDELFNLPLLPDENRIIFPYSRLICDVERFRDDRLECMAERGMGVCYQVTSSLQPLKRVTTAHKEEMFALYDHHHSVLTAAADRTIEASGSGLLIDCHSFSSVRLPYESVGDAHEGEPRQRPDICIGTDLDFHTPAWLLERLVQGFRHRGYSVAKDYPFSGTLVPVKYFHRNRRLLSVMIEVNRKLYIDEKTGEKLDGFSKVQADIANAIGDLYA